MSEFTRRDFLAGAGSLLAVTGMSTGLPSVLSAAEKPDIAPWNSPFRVAVITDEISQDFDHACYVASHEFGMQWVEVRGLWNKNLMNLTSAEIAEAQRIVTKYQLRVTDIGSPLFKVDWPGAPTSKYSPKHDQFKADFSYDQQPQVLDKCIEVAKSFQTDRVRGFDFWRLEDQAPYRKAINAKLQDAADELGKHGIIFLLENEMSCNTATGGEAAKTLAAVPSQNFMLNWDPGNAAARGEIPYPNGFDILPKNRIGHCHCKDVVLKPGGEGFEWMPVGKGVINWVGQFQTFKQSGYHLGVSLETHWNGAGTPEESSRQSWAGMKADLQKAGALS
ncbi:MAG TPA: sugar phosphate isomerase/epimerase family protein [Terriglobales bacterium]